MTEKIEKSKKEDKPEEKKPARTAGSIIKQKLNEEQLEKVEAKPYLFGPTMNDVDLTDFNY